MNCLLRIVVLLAGVSGATAAAAPVYKCVDANGAISFQATPCPANTTQTDAVIRNDMATPVAPAETAVDSTNHTPLSGGRMSQGTLANNPHGPVTSPAPLSRSPGPASYECRLPNGEVFYRHDSCPATASTGTSYTTDRVRGVSSTSSNEVQVTTRQISRQEACQKMNSAGAIGREGRDRDQKVSTYDKNRGTDPCK